MTSTLQDLRENAEALLHGLKEQLKQGQRDKGLSTVEPDLLLARMAGVSDLISIIELTEAQQHNRNLLPRWTQQTPQPPPKNRRERAAATKKRRPSLP